MSAIARLEMPLRITIQLVLIGEGKVSAIPEGVKVLQTGIIHGEDQARVMSELDVLVVPSLQDNLPNVMCEALALGVPVIGAETGGIPEVLKKFNLPTYSAKNHEALASILSLGKSLRSLKVDNSVAKEMFSGESYSRKMLAMYRESQK
jgi:glycosyltransferase involved in cell wall biosynthesis